MRSSIFATLLCLPLLQLSAENPEPTLKSGGDFQDPRQMVSLYEWIADGSESERPRLVNDSILVICWMPPPVKLPEGEFEAYQISGIDGYHSLDHVKRFLKAFYALDHPAEASVANTNRINVIVAGNNWGAGIQLKENLTELSKKHQFTVFYAGGWAFRKAVLIEEPEVRLNLIRLAHEHATKSDQAAAAVE